MIWFDNDISVHFPSLFTIQILILFSGPDSQPPSPTRRKLGDAHLHAIARRFHSLRLLSERFFAEERKWQQGRPYQEAHERLHGVVQDAASQDCPRKPQNAQL